MTSGRAKLIATVVVCLLAAGTAWWSFVGLPSDLLADMGAIQEATVADARHPDPPLRTVRDEAVLRDLEDALRCHWDHGRSNLSLMTHVLTVVDARGQRRQFHFSKTDFGQYGSTPVVLRNIIGGT